MTALLDEPHRFNLFQAISLLERQASREGRRSDGLATGDGAGERVRLTGHVALGFASSDVHGVAVREPARGDAGTARRAPPVYVLATQAMSLAGGHGPLPQPYTEMVLARQAERDHAMRDFLDIFNHRFIGFLFRGRKKYAPALNWESLHASPLASCVRSIAHLDSSGEARGDMPWLRHAGLMTAAPRSMTGLLRLLADRFGLALRGEQFVGAWLPLEPGGQVRLGGGAMLNARQAVGARVWDQAAAIRLSCHGVDTRRLRDFLPTGRAYRSLSCVVKRYLPCPIDIFLELKPASDVDLVARVGGAGAAQLGWTSWLRKRPDGDAAKRDAAGGGTRAAERLPPVRMRL